MYEDILDLCAFSAEAYGGSQYYAAIYVSIIPLLFIFLLFNRKILAHFAHHLRGNINIGVIHKILFVAMIYKKKHFRKYFP